MHPQLTILDFLIGALALMVIFSIVVAAFRERRRRNRAPFLNYFSTQFERDYPKHCFFSERDE